MSLRRLEIRFLEYGKLSLVFATLVISLVAIVVNIQTQAFLLSILPIDAGLCVALMINRVCMLVLLGITFVVMRR